MSDKTMSGAEVKVLLTGLGLSTQWLADQLGVTKRTVIRWLDEDRVPPDVVAEMDRITAITNEEMNRVIYAARSGVIHTQRVEGVQQLNTLPASWHRALAFRALERIRAQGGQASVAYLDPKGPPQPKADGRGKCPRHGAHWTKCDCYQH